MDLQLVLVERVCLGFQPQHFGHEELKRLVIGATRICRHYNHHSPVKPWSTSLKHRAYWHDRIWAYDSHLFAWGKKLLRGKHIKHQNPHVMILKIYRDAILCQPRLWRLQWWASWAFHMPWSSSSSFSCHLSLAPKNVDVLDVAPHSNSGKWRFIGIPY